MHFRYPHWELNASSTRQFLLLFRHLSSKKNTYSEKRSIRSLWCDADEEWIHKKKSRPNSTCVCGRSNFQRTGRVDRCISETMFNCICLKLCYYYQMCVAQFSKKIRTSIKFEWIYVCALLLMYLWSAVHLVTVTIFILLFTDVISIMTLRRVRKVIKEDEMQV